MKKQINLYNGTVKIWFEEKDWCGKKIHVYTDKSGQRIESNTRATGIIDKSNGLIPWAVKLMGLYLIQNCLGKPIGEAIINIAKKEWRKAKEEAADIGTEIHDFIFLWFTLKKKPPMPENEKVRNGVIAFLQWAKENKIKSLCAERIVYSRKYNVVGRLDGISYDKDDKYISLDDYKSSNGIYPEMVLQTAGYLMMIEEELEYLTSIPFKSIKSAEDRELVKLYEEFGGFKKRRIIKFGKEDGNFEVRELNNHKKDIKGFLAALELKNRTEEIKKELK